MRKAPVYAPRLFFSALLVLLDTPCPYARSFHKFFKETRKNKRPQHREAQYPCTANGVPPNEQQLLESKR